MIARWRRRILWLLVALLLAALIPVAKELYARRQARHSLDEVIAELDRTDPRWRLEDIDADRLQVPAEKNAALVTVAAHALLPKKWYDPAIGEDLDKIPPPAQPSVEQAGKLTAQLNAVEAALRKARMLKDMPLGRHRLEFSPDWVSTLIPDQTNVRNIAILLDRDVRRAVLGKDMVQAWESHRALLNCGRSLGDEPLLISVLYRLAIDAMAVSSLERMLALEQMPLDHLKERQQALEEESAVPLFRIGMRGDRAGSDHLMTNIETGKIGLLRMLSGVGKTDKSQESGWWDGVNEFFTGSMVLNSHATILRFQTAMVEASKLPPGQRLDALHQIELSIKTEIDPADKSQIMARLLLPSAARVAEAEARAQTQMACGVAGLAAERFRLMRGRWPDSAGDLVQAGLLKAMPLDAFDGNPLRFRRTADGVVFYSIGQQKSYEGKALDNLASFYPNIFRIEFRLWDPERRRQPKR